MADDESDLDLLVVMPVEGTRRQARLAVRAALGDVRTPLDILVYTPEEVTCLGGVAGHMLRSALREGRVLYDRYA
jgi:predicted nucleotidyltransferase